MSNIQVNCLLSNSQSIEQTPCIQFATGVLQGKYRDLRVFTGLVEAMVSRVAREERGVGMQNFKYSPAWDEFVHILKLKSPRAHQFLANYFPAWNERSIRQRESRRPRFPMIICSRSFELVAAHLTAVCYSGPVAMCCDDSKLHSAWRLYWDNEEEKHYLIGAAEGPYVVANPDLLRKVIESARLTLATKLRLWCLQIPLPKMAPIIVAALPIAADNDATILSKWSLDILSGLRSHQIQVVSSSHDGTEVERAVQRIMADTAETTKKYSIPSPCDGVDTVEIEIPVTYGQALSHMQDPKHGLKTYRNNLFSGARLLTLGNFTAIYSRIREVAFEDGTPLYHRDVEKLDRQDDNAAARLFSAKTLKFIIEKHPDYVGETVYLFIHGELIDAYQNRHIPHRERIKMALRALYFHNGWRAFLRHAKYSEAQYYISREAKDITTRLVHGLIRLIIIYRDYITGDHPLLLWLHTTEPGEHSFAALREIAKDFTASDVFHSIPNLHVKQQEAVLRLQSPDFKARAQGYCHTYFYADGVDLQELARFPTDLEIQTAADEAADEAHNLLALLGLNPTQLSRSTPNVVLPGVTSFDPPISDNDFGMFDSDPESEGEWDTDSDSESVNEGEELDCLVAFANANRDTQSTTKTQDDNLMRLTFAATAVDIDAMQTTCAVRSY